MKSMMTSSSALRRCFLAMAIFANIALYAQAVPATGPCRPNPCRHGGKCNVTVAGTFQCACKERFAGPTCADINDCNPDPCINGFCVDGMNTFTCTCHLGWTGTLCDQDIDDCSPNPCLHGACTDGLNSFACTCDAGWTGTLCDQNIDDCSPNPCLHGACTDGLNSFTCTCDAGWTGILCDQNIDDCSPNPCLHGACTDGLNSFTCTCDAGWTGTLCDQNIDDCSPNPCLHGACTDGVNSFTCTCDAGWTGTLCDQTGTRRQYDVDETSVSDVGLTSLGGWKWKSDTTSKSNVKLTSLADVTVTLVGRYNTDVTTTSDPDVLSCLRCYMAPPLAECITVNCAQSEIYCWSKTIYQDGLAYVNAGCTGSCRGGNYDVCCGTPNCNSG